MEVYAAMVDRMDQGIGRIVAELKKDGQLRQHADLLPAGQRRLRRGHGPQRAPTDQPIAPAKPMAPDDLQPKIWPPMQTRDGRPVRSGPGVMPGPEDTYVAYGRGWANVSNTPFREYKHWVHEGGISTPLIVHWPAGHSRGRRGELESQPGHLIDIMATCVDVAGAAYPREVDGEKIKPMEGVSLVPAFAGKPLNRKPIFWEHESNRAIRDGQWKLVAKADQPWELYDMDADRTEMNNLAAQQPKGSKAWPPNGTVGPRAPTSSHLGVGAMRLQASRTEASGKRKELPLPTNGEKLGPRERRPLPDPGGRPGWLRASNPPCSLRQIAQPRVGVWTSGLQFD